MIRPALVLLLALVAAGAGAQDTKPAITDLQVMRDGGAVRLGFSLVGAFDDEVRARIDSGLPTGFVYEAKVEKLRRWWFNDTVARARLEVVTMYNAVTREYLVNTKQDGKLIDSRTFGSRAEAEAAMTTVHDAALFDLDLGPRHRLVVMVRAELGSRTLLTLFPTTVHTDWAESGVFRLGGR